MQTRSDKKQTKSEKILTKVCKLTRPCRFERVQTKYNISNRKCRPDLIKCRPGLTKCRPDLRKCRKCFMSVMESAHQA